VFKVLLPEKIRNAAELLGTMGFRQEVDDFVLSMNRVAEKAAGFFADALKDMNIDDAVGIWKRGKIGAMENSSEKTGGPI
jgi:hypothetical protein